jgi:N-acetylmuramoyl-L-alanine amidase
MAHSAASNAPSSFLQASLRRIRAFAIVFASAPLALAQFPTPPQPPAAPSAPPSYVVFLDAAHGGNDTGGKLDDGQLEKNATLALSVRLRSLLAARGFQVVTTREEDKSLTPNDRAVQANGAHAQACLILHAAESGHGVHLFTSSVAPATDSGITAHIEAWRTAQSAVISRSLALAGVLNSALTQAGINVTLGRTALPGIDSMTCPAVAIELAPERDANHKITAEPDNTDYQAQIAQILATALIEWKSEPKMGGPQP